MSIQAKDPDIEIGSVWLHKAGGGRYKVTDFHEGADHYEIDGKLILRVGYVQLDDGVKRKAGSPYSRSIEDFLTNFERT